jgi:hypothetical protein
VDKKALIVTAAMVVSWALTVTVSHLSSGDMQAHVMVVGEGRRGTAYKSSSAVFAPDLAPLSFPLEPFFAFFLGLPPASCC